MNETMITIAGNVATELRFVRSDRGTSLVSFRLASTPRRYDRNQGGWVDGQTTYVTVVCWRTLAENVAGSLHKGDPVVVFGRLRVENWERDGKTGTTVEIEAQALGHDLSRGTSAFRRTRREQREVTSDTSLAEELARSWDTGETADGSDAAGEEATSGDTDRPDGHTDVGVDHPEDGAMPTRRRGSGQSPLADAATSDGADRRAA
ncbi:single-stranded DNA-binding protein [Actinopolymorpha rutila]|uniref:Single-stranded DNA-binding protein n=1 Tax=Actinopolymorpha rutila TaxID=446787 RepID=A0A852ZGN4_9ACTN|nr:single-stranded DNA-binding protein [Actinopolymorpha rutila]NYH91058.1 single-strand DNA-binding protein [Actinopolymorpha rutila]